MGSIWCFASPNFVLPSRGASVLHSLAQVRMYSNRQVEENRFWAKSLTFGDIHALIAKAEHSRQVLHETLEDLELQERDLRATLRRTEARVAHVRHHRKKWRR